MLFKSIDERIKELGFEKIDDNDHVVSYERKIKDNSNKILYTQVVDIYHKHNGKHLMLSYDKNLFDDKRVGNTCVGLTYTEAKLFLKKMKSKKWKS